jgi:superfamily II helicase
MSKREGRTPVVTRETARDKYCNNIFGKRVEVVKRCKSCGTVEPIVEFYSAQKSKAKNPNDTRSICVKCWDEESKINRLKREGKLPFNGATLPI